MAVQVDDGSWARGIIEEIEPESRSVIVEMIDTGGHWENESSFGSGLMPLDNSLAGEPRQIVKCLLEGLSSDVYDSEIADAVLRVIENQDSRSWLRAEYLGHDGFPVLRLLLGYQRQSVPLNTKLLIELLAEEGSTTHTGLILSAVSPTYTQSEFDLLVVDIDDLAAVQVMK